MSKLVNFSTCHSNHLNINFQNLNHLRLWEMNVNDMKELDLDRKFAYYINNIIN